LYHLTVTDQILETSTDSIFVYVETIPPPPSPVSGPSHVCAGSISSYSVDTIPGATSYSWTVPAGAIIQSGQNTHIIQLQWGSNSGTVSVIVGNNCGTNVPSVLPVTVTLIPPAAVEIVGPSHLCQSGTGDYYTDTIPHAITYQWAVPGDAYIISGAGTTSVRIKWGISAGNISVSGQNSCGTGPPLTIMVTLDSLPASAGLISGSDTVCIGKDRYEYSITPLEFATSYGWTLPKGAVIVSGQHENLISVEFGTSTLSGPITAFGINACGNGQASIKQITARNCTGLEENIRAGIKILPNPVSEKLFIHCTGMVNDYQLLIFDQLGKIYYDALLSGSVPEQIHEIDASRFPSGMMYLKLLNSQGSITAKFIVR